MTSEELLQSVITAVEAHKRLGIAANTVRRAISLDQIPARKLDVGPGTHGVWLIAYKDAVALWGNGKRRPGPKPSVVSPSER